MRISGILAVLAVFVATQTQTAAGTMNAGPVEPTGTCINFGDPTVSLSGVVVERIYFGPPGYGETPKQDARETAALLLLDAPVCVNASPATRDDFERDVVLVQLAAVHVPWREVARAAGRQVTVTGSLYSQLTGHHRTRVLMDVYALKFK